MHMNAEDGAGRDGGCQLGVDAIKTEASTQTRACSHATQPIMPTNNIRHSGAILHES